MKEGGPRFINTHTWASSDTIEPPKIESLSVTRGTPRASLDLSGSAASPLQTVDIALSVPGLTLSCSGAVAEVPALQG